MGHVADPAPLPRRTLWVLTVGCGLSVANLYYAQPLLARMAADFAVPDGRMGLAATLGQVGYAVGMLLVVPLGDVRERRGLILAALGATTAALVAAALAPGFGWFAVAHFALGVAGSTPQLIVPLAATLAAPAERGRVVGTVMSGLLVGVLASRTVSGVVGAHLGWRAVYALAAGLMVLLAVVFRSLLPRSQAPGPHPPYGQLLGSLVGLFRAEPVLRESCLFGAMAFAAFSAFWNTLAFFLAQPPLEYGSDVAGLFGLIGIVGAVAASVAGRLADRTRPRATIGVGLALMLASFGLMGVAGPSLVGLAVGVIVMDLGAQASHISNQARIYALRPAARNRLNTVYMVLYFVGGSTGSALGAFGWGRWGWPGVCAVAAGLIAVGLAGFVMTARPR